MRVVIMIQDVFIIGANGNVGSELVNQIIKQGDTNQKIHANPTRIVGLLAKEGCIYDANGISDEDAIAFASKKISSIKPVALENILQLTKNHDLKKSSLVFIDVTSLNKEMLLFHEKVIKETKFGIVAANKNPLAFSDTKKFHQLTRYVSRYGFRCSVMAGAEAVNFLIDLHDLGEEVLSVEGCFSGTLGYLSTLLQDGVALSDALASAVKEGYTEPNPVDDLNGFDVAKKILILARCAGFDINFDDISIEPFVPVEYLSAKNADELIIGLKKADNIFLKKIAQAKANGKVLRYVASLKIQNQKPILTVGLRELPKDSPLGMLFGTGNKIVVVTKNYSKEKPYIVEAPGAGPAVTAQNIRRDLLAQLVERITK